jgi:hypothetical protein
MCFTFHNILHSRVLSASGRLEQHNLGFVQNIKKESPHQTVAVVSKHELTARKPPASVISIGRAGQRNEIVPGSTKVVQMPRREPKSNSK